METNLVTQALSKQVNDAMQATEDLLAQHANSGFNVVHGGIPCAVPHADTVQHASGYFDSNGDLVGPRVLLIIIDDVRYHVPCRVSP
jgi:hypothetical protein